jgi:hypothetical protein
VLLEAVDEDAHLEVPQLNRTGVERRGEEGEAGVESDSLDAVRLGLELLRFIGVVVCVRRVV